MSWATVSAAIDARLDAITGIGKVDAYTRYSDDAPDSTPFKNIFVSNGVLNHWGITRVARRTVKSASDDATWTRQHDVEINIFYALSDADESELAFQALLDTVLDNLESGDRTLGGVCKTHGDPQARNIGHSALADGPLCHTATIAFTVEETSSESASPLPAVYVRNYTSDQQAMTNRGTKWELSLSIWLYKAQVTGQNHQQELMEDLKVIHELLASNYRPNELLAAGAEWCSVPQQVIHDELSHPLGDASKRVSCGEILLKITARDHNPDLDDPWLPVAQALVAYLAANLTSLSLTTCELDKTLTAHPRYPAIT